MNLSFINKKITGILTILPRQESRFEDELGNYNFPPEKSLRLKKIMGYDRHRLVDAGTCVSDLSIFGLRHLFEKGLLQRDEIDAMILVTQTPDYLMPPTSSVIHGKLGLKQDMLCLDINQGCAGFLVGLVEAFLLLDQEAIRKVVIVNADILSRKTSPHDRNSFPLIGDAAEVTIVERGESSEPIYAEWKVDGSRSAALMVPAGGMKLPSSPDTSILTDSGDGNLRSQDHLVMDGTGVFNFVQTEVPVMIEQLLDRAGLATNDIDFFMFHQPNRFMIEKLADRLNVPYNKMPGNIVENFGNASGVTIPTNLTFNLGNDLLENTYKICLAGFGTGLTWSSMVMNIGGLSFCHMIDY